jgi:hypothetical protein
MYAEAQQPGENNPVTNNPVTAERNRYNYSPEYR